MSSKAIAKSGKPQKIGAAVFAVVVLIGLRPAAAAETYEQIILADKPIAYFRFDETSGAAAKDASGNGRDGIYKGGVVLGEPSASAKLGASIAFGADKSRVHIPRNPVFKFGTRDLTVEFWFNCRETVATRGDILSFKGEGKDFALFKPVGNANLLAYAKPGRAFQAQTDPVKPGVWHHAVYVRRENVDSWYINGELSGTATGHLMAVDMNAEILIGTNHCGGPDVVDEYTMFNGSLDEFAFYDTALAVERVQAHYAAGSDVKGSEKPLVSALNSASRTPLAVKSVSSEKP
jgi:hypothetical protein